MATPQGRRRFIRNIFGVPPSAIPREPRPPRSPREIRKRAESSQDLDALLRGKPPARPRRKR